MVTCWCLVLTAVNKQLLFDIKIPETNPSGHIFCVALPNYLLDSLRKMRFASLGALLAPDTVVTKYSFFARLNANNQLQNRQLGWYMRESCCNLFLEFVE